MAMFLDFNKVKKDPDGILHPQKLIDLIEAAMEDQLYFVVDMREDGNPIYIQAAMKDSYAALVAVLIQEGGAGKFQSDIGWGTYIGSVTTLLTLMVGEAMEQERFVDKNDLPFEEPREEPREEMPPISEADIASLYKDFERWASDESPDAPPF